MKVKHNILHPKSNITPHLTGERKIILLRPKNILFTLATLFAGVFVVGEVSALTYSNEMDVQFTFNPTVSINVTGDLSIAELAPGNALDSSIITVTAGSNETNGYTLYSTVGSSTNNYTDLRLSSSNDTNVFTSLSTSKSTLADFDNNTWGYSYCLTTNDCSDTTSTNPYWVSGSTGNTTTGYNGLPIYNASDNTTGIKLADASTAAETELKFKIGAKAASTQASGTYTNTVNFIGVAKVITTNYTLNYNANAGSDAATVTNMPANIPNGTTNTSAITLSTTTPVRENYAFKGWCTDNSSETSCSDTLYGPGRVYIFANPGTTTTVNLYAIWESSLPPVDYCEGSSYDCMQNLVATSCTTAAKTVIDGRDGTLYKIQKLADNNCWMLDNLALDPTSLSLAALQGRTNASNATLWYFKNGGGFTDSSSSLYKYAKHGVANWGSTNSYSDPLIASNGTGDNGAWTKDTMVTSYGAGSGKVGIYYNYCAASAGSYCFGNGTSYGISTGDATEDICPAGWRMPTGGNSGETVTLYGKYNTTQVPTDAASLQYNLSTPLSGYFADGLADLQDTSGYWWASTRGYNSSMYVLRVEYGDYITVTAADFRYLGYSVRCLLNS